MLLLLPLSCALAFIFDSPPSPLGATLFYFSPKQKCTETSLRELRRQMDRTVAKQLEELEQQDLPAEEVTRQATGLFILDVMNTLSAKSVKFGECTQYVDLLKVAGDPCIEITYDESSDKCRVAYNCKTTVVEGAARSIAPITGVEAENEFRKIKRL